MVRAGQALGKIKVKAIDLAGIRTYHLTPGAWTAAVGKKLGSHTRPAFLDAHKLIVEVADAVWQAQLSSLRGSILARLEKVLGPGVITSLEFRVAPPKRAPQLAVPAELASTDEADNIQDPIMRRIYKTARRKASA